MSMAHRTSIRSAKPEAAKSARHRPSQIAIETTSEIPGTSLTKC